MSIRKKSYPYSDEGSFPILAEFHDAEDDLAFEKMSDELLAYKSDHGSSGNRPQNRRKTKLKNPSGSCTTPHEVGGVGSGDGTCYQKHHEYGTAGAGTNGSTERAEYMKKYRKTKKNPKGVWTPEAGPETGKKMPRKTVPKPFGNSKKRASIRVAYLMRELEVERQNLISLASENPQIIGEVNEVLNKVAHRQQYKKNQRTKRYHKKKDLYNPRGDGNCLKGFNGFSSSDYKSYAQELLDKGSVDGHCYQTHNEYGEAKKGKAYQDWYNKNVRQYKSPKDSSKPFSGEYNGPQKGIKRKKNENIRMPAKAMKEVGKQLQLLKNPPSSDTDKPAQTTTVTRVEKKTEGVSFAGRSRKNKDTKKTDTSKTDTSKTDTSKPKTDTSKPKTDTSKTDTSKPRSRSRSRGTGVPVKEL